MEILQNFVAFSEYMNFKHLFISVYNALVKIFKIVIWLIGCIF